MQTLCANDPHDFNTASDPDIVRTQEVDVDSSIHQTGDTFTVALRPASVNTLRLKLN